MQEINHDIKAMFVECTIGTALFSATTPRVHAVKSLSAQNALLAKPLQGLSFCISGQLMMSDVHNCLKLLNQAPGSAVTRTSLRRDTVAMLLASTASAVETSSFLH